MACLSAVNSLRYLHRRFSSIRSISAPCESNRPGKYYHKSTIPLFCQQWFSHCCEGNKCRWNYRYLYETFNLHVSGWRATKVTSGHDEEVLYLFVMGWSYHQVGQMPVLFFTKLYMYLPTYITWEVAVEYIIKYSMLNRNHCSLKVLMLIR